jgi:FHA domain
VIVKLGFKLIDGKDFVTEVTKDKFVIGRSQRCDVVIANEGLSREHCLVEIEDDDVYVSDLGSANGVYINDERIPANQKTKYNMSLGLAVGTAEVTKFVIELPKSAMEIDFPIDQGSGPTQSAPETGKAARSTKSKKPLEESASSGIPLHPSVKGLIGVVALAVAYLLYSQMFGSDTNEDNELYQKQFDASMKSKSTDGSIKTRNF